MEIFPLTRTARLTAGRFRSRKSPSWKATQLRRAQGELEVQLAGFGERPSTLSVLGRTTTSSNWAAIRLLAAQLFAQIEGKLGMNLPLAILFQARRFGTLRKNQTKHLEVQLESLVPIQPQGDKRLVFDSRAEATCFYTTPGQKLGKGSAALRLQSRGLDGHEPMETEIESMAGHTWKRLSWRGPKGPIIWAATAWAERLPWRSPSSSEGPGCGRAAAMIETYNLQSRPPIPFLLRRYTRRRIYISR